MTVSLAQLAGLFTAPALAAAGAACVAIPVIIHLLSRTRRTRAEWGAMRFLRLAYKKQKRKLRMEKWLLLLLRCAVMVVAGLALAGPLLSGAWGGLTSGGNSGRTVHIVLEDGLSTRAAVGEATRFDALQNTAIELVDGLSPNDTVQLWLASANDGPHPDTPTPTLDHSRVRDILEDLAPGYGRSVLPEVLQRVAESIGAEGGVSNRPPVVAVLSDFSRGATPIEQSLAAELAALGGSASVVVTRPDLGSGNLQIQSLRPRRGLVLTGTAAGETPTVSVEVVARRFDAATAPAGGQLELFLTRPDGEALPAVSRQVRWSTGQATTTVSVELPLGDPEDAGGTSLLAAGGDWVITGSLTGDAGVADAVSEDGKRFAVVEVRPRLNVGIIDEGLGVVGGGLNPAAFIRAALSPEQTGQRFAVNAETFAAAETDEARLNNLDAVIVLRPDTIGAAGWSNLSTFAERGGLVWVYPPATAEVSAADWFGLVRSSFGVDWQLREDAAVFTAPSDSPARLDTEARPPEELLLLSADWSALLGPIRVSRALSLDAIESSQTWIGLVSAAAAEQNDAAAFGDRGVFLAASAVGEGRLLLSTVAIDPAWTNLPTKPVFPALLHDALRGVLGDAEANDDVVVGDTLTLNQTWVGTTRLQQLGGEAAVPVSEGRTLSPVAEPGVYGQAGADGTFTSGGRLAVNVPAEAGDVRAVEEAALAGWLDGLGAWEYLDADEPASVLVTAERRTNLGWALLWVLLALVVFEMLLARWFSHAEMPRRGRAGQVSMNRRAGDRPIVTKKKWRPFGKAALWGGALWIGTPVHAASSASGWDTWLGLDEVSFAEATAIAWRYALPAWAWVLIAAAALAWSWWTYRRLLGPTWARMGLAGLRGLLLILIAVLLAGPEVVRTDETVEEDVLLVLVDRSASMTVADTPDEDAGLVSREEALRDALTQQGEVFGEEQLGRGRQVAWLGFGEQAFELASPLGETGVDALGEPGDQTTALRTALEAALRRGAGRPISGIVLVSDGRSPEATGTDLLAKLEQQSVRVYSVPLGAERLPLDLALSRVDSPATAFINDAVPVTVVVDQPGRSDDSEPVDPSRVTVRLIDTETEDVLDEKTLEGVGLGQPLRLEGRSSQIGEAPWGVEIVYDSPDGGEQELNLINNVEAFAVSLIDRPIRVLYVEGYPRWEYRYLKNMLIREPSIDSSIFLLSADRAFAQEGDTPITRLPADPEEWRRYDVVIVGDVPADAFDATQRKQLFDLVAQRGAGVLWMAGPGSMPSTYASTLLSDLLPMRDPEAVSVLPWARAGVVPTSLAETLSVLQLRSSGASGGSEGETPGWPEGLPGLRWVQDLGSIKPSVEVLAEAVLGNDSNVSYIPGDGDAPLVSRLRFGAGQSVYVATDETWRWRYARGEVYFEQFWVQLVRMLGRAAATRGDEAVRMAVSTRSTPVGGTVVVDLDLEDAALLDRGLPSIKVAVRKAGDALERDLAEFDLRPTPAPGSGDRFAVDSDAAGRRYSAPWLANLSGELELVVSDPALSGLDLRVPLDVIASDDELRRAEADVSRLVQLSEATGGRVVPLDDLQQLAEPGVVRNLARKTANDVAEPIWNSALALVLVVGLITLEWIGRKLVRLV
ncbi:MAG: BatA domain-containing protein [Planctomycetota bacterium]